jgi:hypothetical protein
MSNCGLCGKVRAHLPEAIRARLAQVEARMRARKPSIAISYTTASARPARADSPPQLPAVPQGGDGAEGAK